MGGTPNNDFIVECLSLYSIIALPSPKILIETGTYFGKGAAFFAKHFEKVHTIELSLKWYKKSVETLSTITNIECHFGNSVDILPILLSQYDQSIAFYLDAHYSGGDTAIGEKEVPLLDELSLINKRNAKDLIIIDDLRLFGTKGICGHKNHKYYPPMKFNWTSITIENILNLFSNTGKRAFSFRKDDRYIIITNLLSEQINSLQSVF